MENYLNLRRGDSKEMMIKVYPEAVAPKLLSGNFTIIKYNTILFSNICKSLLYRFPLFYRSLLYPGPLEVDSIDGNGTFVFVVAFSIVSFSLTEMLDLSKLLKNF